ncbi:MAG TPA: hypothetical protein PKA88_23285 [Polyangiaceae bacterium]|nr:hypothetical protein [Polyangiaceae bacterium]
MTQESPSGRNQRFQVGSRGVSRSALVKEIGAGQHPGYHVRKINGVDTPVSNPDGSTRNNLG